MWQLSLLAHPGRGPANDAIHCALLSLFSAFVIFMASCLLGGGGHQSNPCQEAHGLSPHCCCGEEAAVLTIILFRVLVIQIFEKPGSDGVDVIP